MSAGWHWWQSWSGATATTATATTDQNTTHYLVFNGRFAWVGFTHSHHCRLHSLAPWLASGPPKLSLTSLTRTSGFTLTFTTSFRSLLPFLFDSYPDCLSLVIQNNPGDILLTVLSLYVTFCCFSVLCHPTLENVFVLLARCTVYPLFPVFQTIHSLFPTAWILSGESWIMCI